MRPSSETGRRRPMTAVRRLITCARICELHLEALPVGALEGAQQVLAREVGPRDRTVSTWVCPTNCMSAWCSTLTVSTSTPSEASSRRPSATWAARMRRASARSRRTTPWLIVRTKSWRTSATRQPSAEVMPGPRRHQHLRDGQLARERDRVERAGAAEGEQDEVARVVAALQRHEADGARHLVVGHPHDAGGDLVRARGPDARRSSCRRPRARDRAAAAPSTPSSPSGLRRPSKRLASVMVGSSPPRP